MDHGKLNHGLGLMKDNRVVTIEASGKIFLRP